MDKFIANIVSTLQGQPRRHLSVRRQFHRRRSAAHECVTRGCSDAGVCAADAFIGGAVAEHPVTYCP